eukprot:GFUD01035743.1.p1 GENE.GFUD01035743.1~~GFUD01035743.1.p1  ORF type:complete len:123 (+),score=33.15 GFUD01035743.1:603-971(+)
MKPVPCYAPVRMSMCCHSSLHTEVHARFFKESLKKTLKLHKKMKNVLLTDPALNDAKDDISHLDAIDHADCKYGDRPLTIDVDKVVNSDLKTKNLLASSDEFELSITTLEDFKKEAADTLEF